MTNSQRLATVRACLIRWLAGQQGQAASEAAIVRETILIRDEFYCGRRFHTANFKAVWFIEEDELKVYHNDGRLACSFSAQQITQQAHQDVEPDVIPLSPPSPARDHQSGDDDLRRAA